MVKDYALTEPAGSVRVPLAPAVVMGFISGKSFVEDGFSPLGQIKLQFSE